MSEYKNKNKNKGAKGYPLFRICTTSCTQRWQDL